MVSYKDYPLIVTGTTSFNLNNRDLRKLKKRINGNGETLIGLKYPPLNQTNRYLEVIYYLSSEAEIAGITTPVYNGTPRITGTLNKTTDKIIVFPFDLMTAIESAKTPSNIYGTALSWEGNEAYIYKGSQYWTQDYAFYRLWPNWKYPAISAVAVNQPDPRNPMILTWTADIQDKAVVEIIQGGVLKKAFAVGTAKTVTIPANTVTFGSFEVKITADNTPFMEAYNDDLGVSNSYTTTLTAVGLTPTVGSITTNQLELRNPINVSWVSTNQTSYKVEVMQGDVLKARLTGTTATTATIPPNTVSEGSFSVFVYVYNTINGVSTTANYSRLFTATLDKPTASLIQINQLEARNPMDISWTSTKQTNYKVEIVQNGSIKSTLTGTTATTATALPNTVTEGKFTANVYVYNTVNGVSTTATISKEFTATLDKPTVSAVGIDNTEPRNPISLFWTSTKQTSFKAEVRQGGVLKANLTGTTEKNVIIPYNTVTEGLFEVTLTIYNTVNGIDTSATFVKEATAVSNKPTVGTLTTNQLEARKPIILNWISEGQTGFIAEIRQGGVLKTTLTGGTDKTTTIPFNTVLEGVFNVNLIVFNTINGIDTSAILNQDFTAVIDKPIITSLEPDSINNNVNLTILSTWQASRQESFILKLIQNEKIITTYTGTTTQQINIPADTFKKGMCKLELSVTNVINGVSATVTRVAEFLGYGKPIIPTFDDESLFNTAKPLFSWIAENQIAYVFYIYKNNVLVETSDEVMSEVSNYQLITALENNTEYVIKVRTKNYYGLWSDLAEKTILTNYTELAKPQFDVIPDGEGGILINLNIVKEDEFFVAEIYRKDDYSDWTRLAMKMKHNSTWTDYTISSNKTYYYKVISTSLSGGIRESEVKSAKNNINHYHFINIENLNQHSILKYNPQVQLSYIGDTNSVLYAGCSKPRIWKGISNYRVGKMTFDVETSDFDYFMNLIQISKVILYKDCRGNKIYGSIHDISTEYVKGVNSLVKIAFTFTETNFLEKDIYSAEDELTLMYYGNLWKLDNMTLGMLDNIKLGGMDYVGL